MFSHFYLLCLLALFICSSGMLSLAHPLSSPSSSSSSSSSASFVSAPAMPSMFPQPSSSTLTSDGRANRQRLNPSPPRTAEQPYLPMTPSSLALSAERQTPPQHFRYVNGGEAQHSLETPPNRRPSSARFLMASTTPSPRIPIATPQDFDKFVPTIRNLASTGDAARLSTSSSSSSSSTTTLASPILWMKEIEKCKPRQSAATFQQDLNQLNLEKGLNKMDVCKLWVEHARNDEFSPSSTDPYEGGIMKPLTFTNRPGKSSRNKKAISHPNKHSHSSGGVTLYLPESSDDENVARWDRCRRRQSHKIHPLASPQDAYESMSSLQDLYRQTKQYRLLHRHPSFSSGTGTWSMISQRDEPYEADAEND